MHKSADSRLHWMLLRFLLLLHITLPLFMIVEMVTGVVCVFVIDLQAMKIWKEKEEEKNTF